VDASPRPAIGEGGVMKIIKEQYKHERYWTYPRTIFNYSVRCIEFNFLDYVVRIGFSYYPISHANKFFRYSRSINGHRGGVGIGKFSMAYVKKYLTAHGRKE
jgi:hypothetical protein